MTKTTIGVPDPLWKKVVHDAVDVGKTRSEVLGAILRDFYSRPERERMTVLRGEGLQRDRNREGD